MKKVLFFIFVLIFLSFSFLTTAQITVSGSTGANGTYTSLTNATGAFHALNSYAQTGNTIIITITSNSTTEAGTNGLSAGTWSSISIYPTTSGLTISGNIVGPLIDLNGADNVTIDGRVNASGSSKDLVISNTNVGGSVIRFINDATYNYVKYSKLQGVTSSATNGIVLFSTTTGTTGNDNNTIDNCDINKGSSSPYNGIYGLGTNTSSTTNNSSVSITNNNFIDFISTNSSSCGIFLSGGNTDWTLSGNSFYTSGTITPAQDAYNYNGIRIDNTNGNNFIVTGNYIGGTAVQCGSGAMTINNKSQLFQGIYLNVGTTTASSLQNNTISNIAFTSSSTDPWKGIYVSGGSVNIGTTTGNTIGATTGIDNISIIATENVTTTYGIYIQGSGTINCQKNNIGSITTNNASSNPTNFYAIYCSGTGTNTIINNIIGSTSTANSINTASVCSGYAQLLYGIYFSGSGTLTITGNTIANLKNSTTNTTTSNAGLVTGIATTIGTITNNTIHDLTISNANTATNNTASVCGIALTNTGTGKTVTGNTIYNLSNTYASFAGSLIGLYVSNNTSTSAISSNFIHSFSVNAASTAASLYGISINTVGSATYANNIINLGGNTATTIYGIYDGGSSSQACNINFNTVYIGGSLSSGITNKSYCLYGATTGNTRNYSNNIFVNARSTTSGASLHYAAYFNFAVATGLTLNYNDYYVSGLGGVLGYYNGANVNSLPLIATMDANSMNVNPLFALAGGTTPANYIPGVYTLAGTTISTISNDYSLANRAATPTMGAFEVRLNLNIDVYINNAFQASYTTLKSAFDKINIGAHTGAIEIRVKASTTETASATIYQSGYSTSQGTSNYSSILIYPTSGGLTIGGNLNASLIDLIGADNVTIDGRVNATGATKSLVLDNTSTGASANTVRFFNSAENNTIEWCTLKGSETYSAMGVVYFSTSSSGNGNTGNTITYNDITTSGSNRPLNAIYSYGTSGRENSNNTVSYNNIFDILSPYASTSDIQIGGNSNSWTISSNSLYETTTVVPTGVFTYEPIRVNTSTYNLISGNYIGGSAPNCGGTAFTVNANTTHYFCGIYVNGGNGNPCIVQNNIISNINYTSVEDNPWDGIFINSGDVNIIGNTIGATTGTGSITITTPLPAATAIISGGVVTTINLLGGGSGYTVAPVISFTVSGSTTPATATANLTGGVVSITLNSGGSGYTAAPNVSFDGQSNNYSTSHGIINAGIGTVLISNNNFGSITTVGSNYYTHGFETTYNRGATGTTTFSNNLIGSLSSPNSINISSPGNIALQKQDFYGFYNSSGGTVFVTGNTIQNVTNAYTGVNTGSRLRPIASIAGSATIQNNTIKDIKSSSSQTGGGNNASIIGIVVSSALDGTTQTVSGNTISNLTNINVSAATNIYGIFYLGANTGTNTISGNFIHSFSFSPSNTNIGCEMDGIYLYNGLTTTSNNIINLGVGITTGVKIYGIFDASGPTNNNSIYFNSVYIGGTVASGVTSNTSALYNNANTSTRDYRNNIFYNARSGGTTGKHYSIILSGVANTTIDYNDYYVSGTGGLLGKIGNLDKASLTLWQSGTLQDVHSQNTDPGFTIAGGTSALNYYTSTNLTAVSITGITADYAGQIRGTTPKMGALEVTNYTWQGGTSDVFSLAANWTGGLVPPNGADISFATTPSHDCVLDQNRTLGSITNTQSTYKLVVNGKQLTITENLLFTGGAQIDATTASSMVVFAGTAAQSIPSSSFVSNIIDGLTINNANGLTLNGDLTISSSIALIAGNFAIGPNTLIFNGVVTAMTGTVTGGSSTNMIIGGSGGTINMPAFTLHDLTINRVSGVSLYGNVNIVGTLTLTNGTLTVGANTLTLSGSSPIRTSGTIDASNPSATLVFNNSYAITLPASIFTGAVNNLTLSGAGGITASSDFTVNGVLNLAASNPSPTKSILDLWANTLTMGANATTIGAGDVTGIVKRNSFVASTNYTFGSQFTTITFASGNIMPNDVSFTISIGTATSNKSSAVKRIYDVIYSGTPTGTVTLQLHYLDSELQSNTESSLIIWDHHSGASSCEEHGKANQNTTDNWVAISNRNITYFATTNNNHLWFLSNKETINYVWQGQASSDWNDLNNWSAGAVPDLTSDVVIPDAATTANDPFLPTSPAASVKTIDIQPNGILNGGEGTSLTIAGATGAWLNEGSFNPGTSTVVFTNANATMADPTNFHNLTINSGASLTLGTNNIMRIAGTLTNNGTLRAALLPNTIEFNGTDQTIINPNGLTTGFYNLILSGSGTKSMPSSPLSIAGYFLTTGTATATAKNAITVGGDVTIEDGSTFIAGNFIHSFKGNFHNQGIFTASTGSTITMNGTTSQMINGGITTNFYNLIINNSNGVNLFTNANVTNTLTLTNGNLSVGETTLGINGTISKTSGFIQTDATSSLSFGGIEAITLPNNLFASSPSINNLTVNRTNGLTLGNQNMTVNGLLDLASGAFSIGGNTLTINGSSPTRTNGEIDASNANAALIFSNPSAIVLPASIFSGNVNNISITGTGGVTASSDFTINGILNLQNANPSDIKGSLDMRGDTLTMGALATTIGIGDVTGYVKRTSFLVNTPYTFGNQYTTINLVAGGTLPSKIWVNIVLAPSEPSWISIKTHGINRYYDIAQSGGNSSTLVVLNLHYLDSELNEATKNNLDVFDHHESGNADTDDHGRSNDDILNNWVGLANRELTYIAPSVSFPSKYWTVGTATSPSFTWLGAASNVWSNAANWVGGVPYPPNHAFIPDASTTVFSPMLPDTASVGYITIQPGGVLNATNGTPTFKIKGSVGAWDNMGTFNAGTSTVIFTHANATISDPTNFYNVTVAIGAKLTLATNNIMKIGGALTISGILNASTTENTVEFNGSDAQTIPNANGSTPGYHNLVLSGSGTKTLPATLDIVDEFTNNGTVNFGTGTVNLDGNSLYGQEISGTSPSTFYNLTLNNSGYGATLNVNAGVSHTLTLTSGKLSIGNYDLTVGSSASILGSSSTNYIITNGTGSLSQNVSNNTTDVVYPIGLASSYLPVSVQLSSGSTADNIKARVGDGLYTAYNSSNVPTGSLIASNVVTKTWYLREGTIGGSNATVKVQWNSANQGTSFDNTKCNMSTYTASAWKYATSSAVSGNDPFTQSISGITSFSPLGVFAQTLSGNINYYNVDNSPLTLGITAKLYQSNVQIGSDYAVTNGTYLFKGLPPGSYELRTTSGVSTAGAVNGTDAAQVNAWGTNPYSIEKIRFYTGDVTGSGNAPDNFFSALDPQQIMDNFVNGTPFDRSITSGQNWTFWTTDDLVSSNSAPAVLYPSVMLIAGIDLQTNLYGLCNGDFNRSFVSGAKAISNLDLIHSGTRKLSSQQTFDLPIHIVNSGIVGVVSLVMNFPADLVTVEDVTMSTTEGMVKWSVHGNELRIAWFSDIALNLNAEDILATLHLKTTDAFSTNSSVEFTLAANPANELADGQYEVIPNAIISIDAITPSATGIQNLATQDPSHISLNNYPNPFSGITTLFYELPFKGQMSLEVYNFMGTLVTTLVNEAQQKGIYNLKFDAKTLPSGIYVTRLTLTNEGNKVVRNIKMIHNN